MTGSMTSLERVQAALDIKPVDHTPVALSFSYFVARHSNVTMENYLLDLDLQARLQHEEFDRLGGVDYVLPFPSKMIDPMPAFVFMPMKTKVPGRDLPADAAPQYEELEAMPVEGYETVVEKGWQRYVREDLIPRVFGDYKEMDLQGDEEADARFYEERGAYYPQKGPGGFVPFELFSFARSLEKFTADLYRHQATVVRAMDAIIDELIQLGLDGIQQRGDMATIGISRCSNGFISPRLFEKFAFPYILKMVDAFVSAGSPIYFHLDQSWTKFLPYFQQFPEGKYILHLDGMTDMCQAKQILGDRMCIMGDIPAPLFTLATPEAVSDHCKKLIDTIGAGGGYILAPGCSAPDNAKYENVLAMVETARNYRPKS